MLTGVPSGLDKGARVGSAREKGDFTSPGPQTSMSSPAAPARGGAKLQNICPECFSLRDFSPPPSQSIGWCRWGIDEPQQTGNKGGMKHILS